MGCSPRALKGGWEGRASAWWGQEGGTGQAGEGQGPSDAEPKTGLSPLSNKELLKVLSH